ncbi:MAG: type 4a pilus biogenesis protein PilO [Halanaerobacter sp.]
MAWWRKLNQREQILLIIVLTIILPGAVYFYFYQPLQKDIAAQEKKLEQLQADFAVEKKLAAQKPELQKEYIRLKGQLTNSNQLVTRESLPELIISLNQLAAENNLSLEALRPRDKKEVKDYLKYPINLQLEGSYHNMLTYLEDIYQLQYLLRVENITFSSNSRAESDRQSLRMGLKVVGYTITDDSKGD